MTREEQMYKDWEENIANAYEEEIDDTCFSVFLDGVKWADEHPNSATVNKQKFIEKACTIYRKHLTEFNPMLKEFTTALDEAVNIFKKQLNV